LNAVCDVFLKSDGAHRQSNAIERRVRCLPEKRWRASSIERD